MVTLFILASERKAPAETRNSWEDIRKNGLARGYGLRPSDLDKLEVGCPVVLIRKDGKKRCAEGRYVNSEETDRWAGSRKRFDLYFSVDKEVQYPSQPPIFPRWGVLVK